MAAETVTEALGTVGMVIAAVLVFPSLVAVMVAEPGATPVTWPLGLTVATVVSLLFHVTVRPARVPPAESFGVRSDERGGGTGGLSVAGADVWEANWAVVRVV